MGILHPGRSPNPYEVALPRLFHRGEKPGSATEPAKPVVIKSRKTDEDNTAPSAAIFTSDCGNILLPPRKSRVAYNLVKNPDHDGKVLGLDRS